MSKTTDETSAYVLLLDAIQHGWVHYRTFSIWERSTEKSDREVRKASSVQVEGFIKMMNRLGQRYRWVRDETQIASPLETGIWTLLPIALVETQLPRLLEERTCVRSALGLYWDKRLRRDRVTNDVRQAVLKRDGHRCLVCDRREEDGVELTMQHVIPFSSGGETTADNLVTLCKPCNNEQGNEMNLDLFALADLHHGWDPRLLKTRLTTDSRDCAIELSSNIMVSRCKVDELPGIIGGDGGPSDG